MQDLAASYLPGDSPKANHTQSTSRVRPKRRAILPASSPFPPLARAPGGANVMEFLLGRTQASTFVEGTSCASGGVVDIQQHRPKSLVSHSDLHLPVQHRIPDHRLKLVTVGEQATGIADSRQHQTVVIHTDNDDHNNKEYSRSFIPSILDACNPEYRGLTPSVIAEFGTMTAVISAPGSPPELTESRSSKSSSYGSQFSASHDLSTEITHFEDIGLEDDHRTNESSHRIGHHAAIGKAATGGSPTDAYNTARRPSLSTISGQSKTRTLNGASRHEAATNKRGITSPSVSTLTSQDFRQRSVSPPKRLPRSMSTYSFNQATSTGGSSPRSSLAPSRRGSWQPQRKTIKEIEAEYNDSDDELPEDASLWNVPISPHPPAGISPRSSFRGSPERESRISSPQPFPLEHSRSNPERPPRTSSHTQPISRHKLTPRASSTHPPHSNPSSPQMLGSIRNGRAKSWNLAMSDLSPEARIITQNLEHYAGSTAMSGEESFKKSSANSHRSSAPSAIQLPPIQRGALDFMPISKEKEAVLSRTRPSWLPPKDPKEEKKHLKEYQRMMAASVEAEKKKETQSRSSQSHEDITRDKLDRIWDFYVNPTTDLKIIDRRVYDLCWRGISAKSRGRVWQRAVGNTLGLSSKTYKKALERAQAIKAKSTQDLSQHERKIRAWLADIERDAETAFPELSLFQRDGPLWQDLVNVCEAYTCYRSDIGYLYGTQLIGALLLVQISDPSDAFVLMANCFNSPVPLAFQTSDIASTQRAYNRVVSSLGVKFPRLHDYLFESVERGGLGFTPEEVLEPMLRTMFSNGLDLDRLSRVWDIWVFEGDRTLIRSAVAVLGSLQTQIFDMPGDLHLKRRNVQEMLGWGPFNRSGKGYHWRLDVLGSEEAFVDEINAAGKLDYTGH